jgi:hypothetical protein
MSPELCCWYWWRSPEGFSHDLYQSKRTQYRSLKQGPKQTPSLGRRSVKALIAWQGWRQRQNEDLKPVMVRMHNGWQLGFLADSFNDGQVAVFIPARLTLRREWCRLSVPTTSPFSIFLA